MPLPATSRRGLPSVFRGASASKKDGEADDPERQSKHWERVIWLITLIGGIHLGFTTWMTGWTVINGRRDIILGIGQKAPLPSDLAHHLFYNDWITCSFGFFGYAVCFLGFFWAMAAKYKPIQIALVNPFGMTLRPSELERRRTRLAKYVGWVVGGIIVLLMITIVTDAVATYELMEKYCVTPLTADSNQNSQGVTVNITNSPVTDSKIEILPAATTRPTTQK